MSHFWQDNPAWLCQEEQLNQVHLRSTENNGFLFQRLITYYIANDSHHKPKPFLLTCVWKSFIKMISFPGVCMLRLRSPPHVMHGQWGRMGNVSIMSHWSNESPDDVDRWCHHCNHLYIFIFPRSSMLSSSRWNYNSKVSIYLYLWFCAFIFMHLYLFTCICAPIYLRSSCNFSPNGEH